MSPEVICISSSPAAQIFARSPTPVVCESPQTSPYISAGSSLLRTPSISRPVRPQARSVTPGRKPSDNFSDNGSVLSGRIGWENLPLPGVGEEEPGKRKGAAPKSSKPNPRKRVSKTASTEPTQTEPAKTGQEGKKPRARKPKIVDKLSNETLKGKVTKPRAGSAPKIAEKPARKSHTPSPEDTTESGRNSLNWKPGCLELDEATSRKHLWTPPKNSPTPILNLTNDDDDALSDTQAHSNPANQSFGELFSNFGFNKQPQVLRDNYQQAGRDGPTKKRRLELVDKSVSSSRMQTPSVEDQANNETAQKPIEKGKRIQKRKLTTITAHATAGYLNDDGEKELELNQNFPQGGTGKTEANKEKRVSKQQSSKPRQTRKKEQGQKKKSLSPGFEILPPEKAFQTFADQDLLFGTLSQLERDESPTLTRDTQLALKNSETSATSTISLGTPHTSQGNISLCTSSSKAGSVASRLASSRNLWSVAARDFEGSLAKADVIDLIDTPKASEALAKMRPLQSYDDEWLDIDTVPETPSKDVNVADQEQNRASNDVHAADNTNRKIENQSPATSNENAEASSIPDKPIFGGYSTAELTKQVASYGFKAIKSRERMISLLEKCWESKHQSTSTVSRNIRPSPVSTTEGPIAGCEKPQASNKTKPGRPKNSTTSSTTSQVKDKAKVSRARSTQANAPITSSENRDITGSTKESSRPSSRLDRPNSAKVADPNVPSLSSTQPPPRAAAKGSSSRLATANSSKRISLPDLSLQIKSAIHSQPAISSHSGRKQPTWHEKFLMYDPIVLEDLATWLNTEGLGRIGEDREVSAGFVREWCENEGICCCWKKGLDTSGGSRGAWT